ncbi:MAG: hypothetical protein EOO20_04805 [Chryseobacterium sp.]|nr:MAG: hypothetical protein EOO20_04805 [Chryseobacterium sp.]
MKAFAVETFPDDFFLNYRGVSFFGKNHPKIVKLKSELEQDRDFSVFFESGNFIFVAAKLEYFSFSSIHEQMKFIVSDQLSYLSAALYSEVQLDKRKNFLVLNSKWKKVGYNINLQEGKIHFSANRLNSLHDNPFTILSKTRNSQAKDWFLNYEPIFIQAFKNNNISMMWQYLEALLPSDDKGEKQIKSLVPTLLLLNEKFNARQRVIKTLYDSLDFLSGGSELLNIPFEDLSSIRKLLEKDKVHPSIIQSDYPFIMELVRVLNTEIDEANTVNITTYYKSILIEAYNIRNFDIHSGKADLKSMLKIQRTLPRMIVRLRWIIMDEIKENPHVPFHILISTLIKKAQKMN